LGGEHTPEICQKLNTLIVAQPMDENVGLTVVGIQIAAVCVTIPFSVVENYTAMQRTWAGTLQGQM
jgi:hypothetical protein